MKPPPPLAHARSHFLPCILLASLTLVSSAPLLQKTFLGVSASGHGGPTEDLETDADLHQARLDLCTVDHRRNGRWPPLGGEDGQEKFDLVLSWWTGRPQFDIASEQEPALLHRRAGHEADEFYEHESEIKYSLRSFEKFGLLDHVRNLVLLIDEEVIHKFGAPRFFNYTNPHLRIVTDVDMGWNNTGTNAGKWSKRLSMHEIPGISDYFLYAPDDDFLINRFSIEAFWNERLGRPKIYNYGHYQEGWCNEERPFGAGHGPVLISKCAMHAVVEHFKDEWPSPGSTRGMKALDALCLYSNVVSERWDYIQEQDTMNYFLKECHTNGGCHTSRLNALPPLQGMFVNLQGNGISDEYGPNNKEHQSLAEYFRRQLHTPSRFELPPEHQSAPKPPQRISM
mmetsp:Transcript_122815/g.216413  ORF Transcript_122815/g.216413 Transcript_122815/m.216413 type:complete len:397 (+) Transcript_122815:53-1243(+)